MIWSSNIFSQKKSENNDRCLYVDVISDTDHEPGYEHQATAGRRRTYQRLGNPAERPVVLGPYSQHNTLGEGVGDSKLALKQKL